jgi:hypothetical protein
MPPIAPVTPRFPVHHFALSILHRKAVYSWPPPSPVWIQEKLQKQIAEMQADGYTPDVIKRILLTLAESVLTESERFSCNVSRATFLAALIETEIQ